MELLKTKNKSLFTPVVYKIELKLQRENKSYINVSMNRGYTNYFKKHPVYQNRVKDGV